MVTCIQQSGKLYEQHEDLKSTTRFKHERVCGVSLGELGTGTVGALGMATKGSP